MNIYEIPEFEKDCMETYLEKLIKLTTPLMWPELESRYITQKSNKLFKVEEKEVKKKKQAEKTFTLQQ